MPEASPRRTFALDVWDPARGGLEQYAEFLLRGLADRGCDPLLLCGRAKVEPPVEHAELGGEGPGFYRVLDDRVGSGEGGLCAERLASFRHPGAACRYFLPLGGLFESALLARRAVESRGLRGLRALARRLSPRTQAFLARERAFFEEGDGVVLASSQLVADEIDRLHPRFGGSVEVTGLPVDLERFGPVDEERRRSLRRERFGLEPEADQGRSPVLLWVGNEPVRKGLNMARAVLRRLRMRSLDARLVLIGQGSERYDEPGRGILGLGRVEDPELLYAAADLLLAPSLEDNLSFSVLEALACGIPALTSARNGAAMHLLDPELGRVVEDPQDLEGFDRACLSLLERGSLDPARQEARRGLLAEHSSARHLDRVQALLELR